MLADAAGFEEKQQGVLWRCCEHSNLGRRETTVLFRIVTKSARGHEDRRLQFVSLLGALYSDSVILYVRFAFTSFSLILSLTCMFKAPETTLSLGKN